MTIYTVEQAQRLQELSEALVDKTMTLKAVKAITKTDYPELQVHTARCSKGQAVAVLRDMAEQTYRYLEQQTTLELEPAPVTPEVMPEPAPVTHGKQVAYIRVSTILQNTERQFDGYTFDRVFTDKASGKTIDRPELEAMKAHVRAGDTINVWSIDRLARNVDDLRSMVNEWLDAGVSIKFHKEQLTFDAQATGTVKAMQRMMLTMMGAFAEFELAIRNERQLEGIAIAKAKGKYKGRPKNVNTHTQIVELFNTGTPKATIAKQLGIGRATVYRVLNNIDNSKTGTAA